MMSKWASYSVASRTHKCNNDMHDTDMCLDQILSASHLGESMFGITVAVTSYESMFPRRSKVQIYSKTPTRLTLNPKYLYVKLQVNTSTVQPQSGCMFGRYT